MKDFEALYEELGIKVYTYLYMRTMDKHLAEELTQETFYQVLRSAHCFQGNASIKTWVFGIAKNVLRKTYRKKRYREQLLEQISEQCPSSTRELEAEILEKSEEEILYNLIQQLDEPQREIVCLRIYGDLSFREIGDVFEKSENWARVNFQRGKLKLVKKSGGVI